MSGHSAGKTGKVTVSGIELEVLSPALAASLAADAAGYPPDDTPAVDARTITQAVPEVVMAVPTPRTAAEERARRGFRARVATAGVALGFEVGADGSWTAEDGTLIVTRLAERPLTLAATVYFVREVGTKVRPRAERTSVLFVADCQETTDAFTIAIRQRGSYDLMRAISIGALERMVRLHTEYGLAHEDLLVLLAPVSGIDAGALIRLIEGSTASCAGDV